MWIQLQQLISFEESAETFFHAIESRRSALNDAVEAAIAVEPSNLGDILNRLHAQIRALQETPLASLPLGWQKGDQILYRIGQDWLAKNGAGGSAAANNHGPDVFVASLLYPIGGHTALIGDFVRALAVISPTAPPPHLIITNCHKEQAPVLSPEIMERIAIATDRIDILPGPELIDRLEQLLARLSQLRPRRLFLFHHPDDPVACAAAQPEICSQRLLIHHADSTPTFGLYLPGVRIIDVTPGAAASTRIMGLETALLLLTVPDPGPRPVDFLERGNLVTASCGTHHKFRTESPYNYPETVGAILDTTRGWHVHAGPLEDFKLSAIKHALRARSVDAGRFIHVPWTQSLASTLWEYCCDLYFASFPIGGARANVEVFASATPILQYSRVPLGMRTPDKLQPEGGLYWHTHEDLVAKLKDASEAQSLKKMSQSVRAGYDRLHHPRVFAAQLGRILEGEKGWDDPDQEQRDLRARERIVAAFQSEPADSPLEFSTARLQEIVDGATES